MRSPRGALPLALALLLIAGCLGAAPSLPGEAPVPAATANEGPSLLSASVAPFRLPMGPVRVFHPIPLPRAAGTDDLGFAFEAPLPQDACLTREPVVLREALSSGLATAGVDAQGLPFLLEASVAPVGSGVRLASAYLGPQIPHPMPNGTLREPTGWPAGEGSPLPALAVRCEDGSAVSQVKVGVSVTLRWVENVTAPEVPYLLTVPEGARTLALRPFRIANASVIAHFTLLRADGSLLGHYGLNSYEAAQLVDLPGPGRYVLHVDHVLGGFVQAALDAPGGGLEPLPLQVVDLPLREGPGQASATIPAGSLSVMPWFEPPAAGPARWTGASVVLDGERGKVLEWLPEDHVAILPAPGARWAPLGLSEREFAWDHHAVVPGAASVLVEGEPVSARVGLRVLAVAPPGA